MDLEPSIHIVYPKRSPRDMRGIAALLAECGLEMDTSTDVFVVATAKDRMLACAGLDRNIVKCIAVSTELRGRSLCLQLVSEIVKVASERGVFHLFLYSRPENAPLFSGCGFYRLVAVPNLIVLMENSPVAIANYCDAVRRQRRPGNKIGCIVMNANPFTLGHRYLAVKAAAECDWLHLFVVGEDASLISYADRFVLVTEGVADLENVTVHAGSDYVISRATFPGYFLKDTPTVDSCWAAIDLLLFREYIAPALGITHRFVGTEPFCQVTSQYNRDMKYWLQHAVSAASPVEVVEVPRTTHGEIAISASRVRSLLLQGDFSAIDNLVPPQTFRMLVKKYSGLANKVPWTSTRSDRPADPGTSRSGPALAMSSGKKS